jgi:hypothetical protein
LLSWDKYLYQLWFETQCHEENVKNYGMTRSGPGCLDHLILSSVEQLEYSITQYSKYYHHERIHQSLDRIIEPKHTIDDTAEIVCIERLGGLLKSYHRLAA